MLLNLSPVASISEAQLDAGKRALVRDSAWASLTGAWSGGVVLVAFALSLGAGPMTIGMLAAIPFMAQAVQLPTIFLVERIRKKKTHRRNCAKHRAHCHLFAGTAALFCARSS